MRSDNEKLRHLLILVITVLYSIAFSGSAIAETPFEGAWLLTETQDVKGNVDSDPMHGLMIFTSTHYSIMYAFGQKPRALMDEENPNGEQPVDRASDEQIVNAYESIVANSGRYEIDGDKILTRAYVAKNPNFMAKWPENVTTFSYSIDDGTLTLKLESGWAAGRTLKYRRVEDSPPP